jgi:hypothetical protein
VKRRVKVSRVSYPKIVTEEIVEGENRFVVTFFELENAALAFFDEIGHLRLGTLSVAVPREEREPPSLTSVLLGDRNAALSMILAEQLATTLGKMVLTSVFLKRDQETLSGPIILRLAKKLFDRMKGGVRE